MAFNFSLYFIQQELGQMTRYLDVVVAALESNFERADSAYEEAMKEEIPDGKFSDDYVEWLISQHEDELMETGQDFPQLLLVSFVILWYAFIEQKLLDFCDELKLEISITPKSNETFHKGIRRAYKFLSQAKNYKIHQSHWQELLSIGRLRNLLVHEGKQLKLSFIKPDGQSVIYKRDNELDVYLPIDDDLYKYLCKHNLFEISGVFMNIIPSIEYCKELIKLGNEVFVKLYADLKYTENS
jgi:hypothetical protein